MDFDTWLAQQTCDIFDATNEDGRCGARAHHRQGGGRRCNAHLDNSPNAPRAFALDD